MKKFKILILMITLALLSLYGWASIDNSSYFSDPGIQRETLTYRIVNVNDSSKNRDLALEIRRSGSFYNVTMTYEYDSPGMQHLNNVISGQLRRSDLSPVFCRNTVNGELYYEANYGDNSVTITSNFDVIPDLEGNETRTLELEDVVMDCELYSVQMRGLNFADISEVSMNLYVDAGIRARPTFFNGEVEVMGTETVNGIECYKVKAEARLVPGEAIGWYETVSPHRLIHAEIDISGNTDGDVIDLVE